jgi:hypothetical protein
MTRLEMLTIVVGRARSHGFEFKKWYVGRMHLPWISAEAALNLLEQQRRYYALLYSHDFAKAFWKSGEEIVFAVPAQRFERAMPDGTRRVVERGGFMRRSARRDAWKYHLREMALAEDPLRYLRKYLNVDEDLSEEIAAGTAEEVVVRKVTAGLAAVKSSREKPIARAIPTDLPKFLRRPYP